jgi:hypothetical protein
MTSEHTSAARMVPDHLTWGEYATVAQLPRDSSEAAKGFLPLCQRHSRGGRPRSSGGESTAFRSTTAMRLMIVGGIVLRFERRRRRSPSFRGGSRLALEAYCGADRKRESSASRSRLRTPSTRSPLTTQVGYALTSICLHRSGRGLIPLGSHSTYGSSFAADPNRAFCSLQAGHQYAPYMIAPTCLR